MYDILFKVGGLFDSEYKEQVHLERADQFEEIPMEEPRSNSFNLEEALKEEGFGLEMLQPLDNIRIYPNTIQLINDKFVIIEGAVENPDYILMTKV